MGPQYRGRHPAGALCGSPVVPTQAHPLTAHPPRPLVSPPGFHSQHPPPASCFPPTPHSQTPHVLPGRRPLLLPASSEHRDSRAGLSRQSSGTPWLPKYFLSDPDSQVQTAPGSGRIVPRPVLPPTRPLPLRARNTPRHSPPASALQMPESPAQNTDAYKGRGAPQGGNPCSRRTGSFARVLSSPPSPMVRDSQLRPPCIQIPG